MSFRLFIISKLSRQTLDSRSIKGGEKCQVIYQIKINFNIINKRVRVDKPIRCKETIKEISKNEPNLKKKVIGVM